MKQIDLNKTVYDLVKEYPEIKDILSSLGFKDITNPVAIEVMGRVMTIPKGAKVKNISLDSIIKTFEENGFEVMGIGSSNSSEVMDNPQSRAELLKSYIQRLNNGENLESVRKDFVKNFENVSVHEIIDVEQGMINDGTDVDEVQKLCDLHSALFHGKTEQEIYLEEEKELNKIEEGHPVDYFQKENRALEIKLDELEKAVEELKVDRVKNLLNELRKVKILYGKKEEIVMPILYRYGITGPSDVMWGVDDEIKAEYSSLAKEIDDTNFIVYRHRIEDVIARTREMIYKEENILYPLALQNLTDEEWVDVYGDLPEMGNCFISEAPKWQHGEQQLKLRTKTKSADNGIIELNGGKLTVAELEAIFKLLPIDITFIDDNEINQFFANEGKVFSRPMSAIGRKVYECHPPRIVPIVENMIKEFKAGTKDHMEVWTPNPENPIRVLYYPVKDEDGNYLGTVELVQQFKDIKDQLIQIG